MHRIRRQFVADDASSLAHVSNLIDCQADGGDGVLTVHPIWEEKRAPWAPISPRMLKDNTKQEKPTEERRIHVGEESEEE